MSNVKLEIKYAGIEQKEMLKNAKIVEEIHEELHKKVSKKDEFLGWLNLPEKYDKKEFEKIKKCAEEIRQNSKVLLVIGIGGSYLGSRAVIESLNHTFYNELPDNIRKSPQILYVGTFL